LAARTSLAIVLLSFAAVGAWMLGDVHGQAAAQKKQRVEEEEETPKAKKPPKKARVEEEEETPKTKTPSGKKKRIEEEDDPKTTPKRKVIPVDEDEDPKSRPGTSRPSAPASGDLKQLASQASHPAIKELFSSLAVPHDLVLYKPTPSVTISGKGSQREEIIEPTPLYLGTDPSRYKRERGVRFTQLKDDGTKRTYTPNLTSPESVRPYEEIAGDEVRRFLRSNYDERDADKPGYLSRADMLTAAEQALSAVLLWHESAKQTGQRKGEDWLSVASALRKQLLDEVLLEQMKLFAGDKDWDKVLALTRRLALNYTHTGDRARILQPAADMIQSALKDPTGSESKKQQARQRLLELELEFPNNPAFKPLSDALRGEAQRLLDEAKVLARNKDDNKMMLRALDNVRKAKETWPQLPDLPAFEIELGTDHPILRVGVRGPLPKYLSPAWACTDSERRAVELLFESLVQLVPDDTGGLRYRPSLAERCPKVVALGRQFELPRNAVWSDGKTPLNSTDIDFSMKLLQDGVGVGRSRVWGELLVAVERKKDPYQVTLRMKQGFLDPLALMSFKILPRDRRVDDEEFAVNPLGSGPFRLDLSRQSDETQRECRFFIANPAYGLRPTKRDAPRIQEIRFYSSANPAAEMSAGKFDVVLDLTAQEAHELRQKPRAERPSIEVPLPSSVPNRRIYFLAINNAKLSDAKVRRALAFAINREGLLDKHFRGDLKRTVHKVVNGPFPAGSWACNPAVSNHQNKNKLDLFDADRAKSLNQDPAVLQAVKAGPYKLKYADDNPALGEAMKELSAQVKTLTGLVLEPTPCDPYRLREDVEQRLDYDVAYYHYDFPDESYWLAPLLGPPPRTDGRWNIFKFSNAHLTTLLTGTKDYRDFATVRKHQWMTHQLLYDEMPFIPMWQLDPLLAYRSEVKPSALDPLLVFGNIADWRLTRK
jgi:ABC-type transport system substrate-binding protein